MKIRLKLVVGAIAIAALAAFYEGHRAAVLQCQAHKLEEQQTAFTDTLSQLRAVCASLSNQLGNASAPAAVNTERLKELLKLRGEVGVLRRREHELEQLVAASQTNPAAQAGQNGSNATTQPNATAPFQLGLVSDGPGDASQLMINLSSHAGESFYVQNTPLLDSTALRAVTVAKNPSSGAPEIALEFNDEGKDLFAAVTKENINHRLAIVLNGQLYSAPVIRSEISGGKAMITGNFSEQEANQLAAKINEALLTR